MQIEVDDVIPIAVPSYSYVSHSSVPHTEADDVISIAVPSFSYVSYSSAPHIDRCTHYHLA